MTLKDQYSSISDDIKPVKRMYADPEAYAEERLVVDIFERVAAMEVYRDYVEWAKNRGEEPYHNPALVGRYLTSIGVHREKEGGGPYGTLTTYYLGLRLV